MAALRIDGSQIFRFAAPPRVNTGSIVYPSTRDATPVTPPAITAHELTHPDYLFFIKIKITNIDKIKKAALNKNRKYSLKKTILRNR